MARLALLMVLGLLLSLACGSSDESTARQVRTRVVRPTSLPTPTPTLIPTATPRPSPSPTVPVTPPKVQGFPTPITLPVSTPAPIVELVPLGTPVVKTEGDAKNLAWVYLSQCTSFDPKVLTVVQIKDDWFVQGSVGSPLRFGVWKVDPKTGDLTPHDIQAREWQPYVESGCSPDVAAALFITTPTPNPTATPEPTPTRTPTPPATLTPVPTATPVVPSTTAAVASLWSYLVKCFPTAELNDLEAVLDPVTRQYVVKDKDEIQYGVWRVGRSDGIITPDNAWARGRDQTVRSGTC